MDVTNGHVNGIPCLPALVFRVSLPFEVLRYPLSTGQNRVHSEARWPKPGSPFHASPRAPSYWPTPAQTRLWPNLKRVHPILATHPSIGYPISITPTRLWPGYSTSSPHAHAHAQTRHRSIAGRGGAFLRSTWSCVRQNFNFVVQSVCDVRIYRIYM